jgi:quinol monooxygenase YgiN
LITMTVQVNVIPQKEKEFLQAVEYLSQDAKCIQGLKSIHLHKDIQKPTSFRLIEEWESEAHLNNYLNGEDFKVILGAIQTLCRSSEINYTKFI